MPLTRFICPDNQQVDTSTCLADCRLGRRCLSKATLSYLSRDRVWDGVPHVTSLLNGTMLEFLKATQPYAVDPREQAYALLGSSHHKLLEVDEGAEIPLSLGWVQGRVDLVEREPEGLVLTDYKSYGSYRVAKLLGLVQVSKGKWQADASRVDNMDEALQLNMYRIMYETVYAEEIARMQLQITVRDGGITAAYSRGVDKKMYMVPVPIMDNGEVERFFTNKAAALATALEQGDADVCSSAERWGDTRCKGYCPVKMQCRYGSGL